MIGFSAGQRIAVRTTEQTIIHAKGVMSCFISRLLVVVEFIGFVGLAPHVLHRTGVTREPMEWQGFRARVIAASLAVQSMLVSKSTQIPYVHWTTNFERVR